MTTAEEAYERYIVKSEKNGTNNNLSTDRGRFVTLYNELKNRVTKWYLNNRQSNELHSIKVLLQDDKPIRPERPKHLDHFDFKLPKDFFQQSFVRAVGEKGKCTGQDIYLYEIKDEDRGSIMGDELYGPSFDYRESPYTFAKDTLKVYVEKDVTLEKIYLSYYKFPNKIGLLDPDNPESGFDPSKEIEFNDDVLDRIISAMVGDFKINNENPSFQADKLREKENLI